MMKQIALIGTSHKYQKEDKDCSKQDVQAFKDFLEKACRVYNIRTVAEEMSEQALEEAHRNNSIPQQAAKALSLKHLFCDPDGERRALLGIEYETAIVEVFFDRVSCDEAKRRKCESRTKRELYWLERLQTVPESEWPVLFICGADHVKSFKGILEDNGFSVETIADDWSP